ncbi:hypothetical protein CDAR_552351 [Caerostris darwini]|uniref:Uncharacterized protein n=1 Tax=Caerostris darwini TaxID=1538125 RepID=A0AAV4NL51_9ARAC|nr:hypothetical protein CDAR_552351 [Caerostris darwini]
MFNSEVDFELEFPFFRALSPEQSFLQIGSDCSPLYQFLFFSRPQIKVMMAGCVLRIATDLDQRNESVESGSVGYFPPIANLVPLCVQTEMLPSIDCTTYLKRRDSSYDHLFERLVAL